MKEANISLGIALPWATLYALDPRVSTFIWLTTWGSLIPDSEDL